MLARVVLERKYGSRPAIRTMAPGSGEYAGSADAALIIGDPRSESNPIPCLIRFWTLEKNGQS